MLSLVQNYYVSFLETDLVFFKFPGIFDSHEPHESNPAIAGGINPSAKILNPNNKSSRLLVCI